MANGKKLNPVTGKFETVPSTLSDTLGQVLEQGRTTVDTESVGVGTDLLSKSASERRGVPSTDSSNFE